MGWYSYDDDYRYKKPKEPSKQPGAIFVKGPIYTANKRGDIGVEWWGRQWVAALGRIMGDGRLERGKRYARNGSVLDLEIAHGQAFAHVQGSHDRIYHTYVRLKAFNDAEWEKALKTLASQAIYAAKLLAGEMPSDIETIFEGIGSSLFPRNLKDIQFECSCPDWGDPCKHSAAVYYLLAEQFDADPFILFHLRGKNREKVLSQLRTYRGETDAPPSAMPVSEPEKAPPLDAKLATFWQGSSANLVQSIPQREEKPFVFRQLGDPPGGLKNELSEIYATIATEVTRWLGLED